MGNGLVNYANFCSDVDEAFQPGKDQRAIIHQAQSNSNFTDEEKENLLALLAAIRSQIKNKRILIKPQL